ncbi:hypothetical protein CAEBREN_31055 [Caenorhabditis brenneri]|uniref:Uncharacterized protein n=1 Tax=Caenorhabditis brenneri TaxID=135651 RepID=G0NRF5_CAEBE|nr:hypothetical protein CAEBREN_31055 [Caenorhabditis brenneri]
MIFLLVAFLFPLNSHGIRRIEIYNRCPFPVWPGIVGPGNPEGGGFRLENEQSRKISVENDWEGVIWGRTFCDRRMRCATGDCGNREQCNGTLGRFPFTVAEFNLNEANDEDVYSVSLINGYNVPILIDPFGGKGCLRAGGCFSDINEICPERMRITTGRRGVDNNVVGCRSPCAALQSDRECCRGNFATPDTCFRSHVAQTFKDACPGAYSYRFDDATSSFGCQSNAEYLVQFC